MGDENYRDAFLRSQPEGQDAMLRYVRRHGEMLTIRISDLPDGGYHLDIEKVGGIGVSACEGALELVLDKDLKEAPQYAPNQDRVGRSRTNQAYKKMGHPLHDDKPIRVEVIDCSQSRK